VCLPVAKHGYSALYIEMKSADGKPTATQAEMMELLREYGNKVIICRRWEEAKHTIEWYLRGDVFKVQELSYTEL
jgi:dienelactone hydrolase